MGLYFLRSLFGAQKNISTRLRNGYKSPARALITLFLSLNLISCTFHTARPPISERSNGGSSGTSFVKPLQQIALTSDGRKETSTTQPSENRTPASSSISEPAKENKLSSKSSAGQLAFEDEKLNASKRREELQGNPPPPSETPTPAGDDSAGEIGSVLVQNVPAPTTSGGMVITQPEQFTNSGIGNSQSLKIPERGTEAFRAQMTGVESGSTHSVPMEKPSVQNQKHDDNEKYQRAMMKGGHGNTEAQKEQKSAGTSYSLLFVEVFFILLVIACLLVAGWYRLAYDFGKTPRRYPRDDYKMPRNRK